MSRSIAWLEKRDSRRRLNVWGELGVRSGPEGAEPPGTAAEWSGTGAARPQSGPALARQGRQGRGAALAMCSLCHVLLPGGSATSISCSSGGGSLCACPPSQRPRRAVSSELMSPSAASSRASVPCEIGEIASREIEGSASSSSLCKARLKRVSVSVSVSSKPAWGLGFS